MKNQSISLLLSFCFIAVIGLYSCDSGTQKEAAEATSQTKPNQQELISRGEYLVQIMGCNDCHSPKRMGPNGPELIPELMLSGYPASRPITKFNDPLISQGFAMFTPDLTAAIGPWGISFAGNITPHETGIGNWTEAQFKKALTEGKYKGLDKTRMMLPPMPWVNYTNMKDEDITAVFTYLKSIQPVDNVVPAPIAPDQL